MGNSKISVSGAVTKDLKKIQAFNEVAEYLQHGVIVKSDEALELFKEFMDMPSLERRRKYADRDKFYYRLGEDGFKVETDPDEYKPHWAMKLLLDLLFLVADNPVLVEVDPECGGPSGYFIKPHKKVYTAYWGPIYTENKKEIIINYRDLKW